MGKKGHGKTSGKGKPSSDKPRESLGTGGGGTGKPKILSRQKRNDLNQHVDRLLKVSSIVETTPNATKDWEHHIEIERLLDKIIQIESESQLKNVSNEDYTLEEFTKWMFDNGAEFTGVKIAKFPGYDYGLQAEKDLNEGDLLVAVPRKLMMTADNVAESVLGALSQKDPMLQHMPYVTLSLLLLIEKFSTNSFWKSYISILPKTYSTVLYFKTSELLELKGSLTLESALKQCKNIARQYAYLAKLFQVSSDAASELLRDVFTYQHYRWAVSTIMTRQNFVPDKTEGRAPVNTLIPFWDMCNHSNGWLSTDFAVERDRSECVAQRSFKANEQVFIFYGKRPNSDLFVHNGFVYMDNEHDSLRMRLGISKSDPLEPIRSKLLKLLGVPTSGDFLLKSGPDPVDGRLLAFLRIFSMRQEHLEHWLASERYSDLSYTDCALETEIETKTWNFLLTRINLLLSAYPTSAQVDTELLAQTNLSPCRRLAIQMRLSEKKILQNSLEYVKQRIRP